MKVFLVTVSSLCFCGILLCFLAYATDRLPGVPVVTSSQQSEISQIALNPDGTGVPPTTEEDLLCAPCVERIAFVLEMVQEWEDDPHSGLEATSTPEARGWEGLLPAQREQVKNCLISTAPRKGFGV